MKSSGCACWLVNLKFFFKKSDQIPFFFFPIPSSSLPFLLVLVFPFFLSCDAFVGGFLSGRQSRGGREEGSKEERKDKFVGSRRRRREEKSKEKVKENAQMREKKKEEEKRRERKSGCHPTRPATSNSLPTRVCRVVCHCPTCCPSWTHW